MIETLLDPFACAIFVKGVIVATLVAATLVIPAVVARMLTHRFARTLWLSTVIGAGSGLVGMNLSYHLDVPSGTTIVLTGAVVFLVVLQVTGSKGLRRAAQLDSHPEPTPAPGVNRLPSAL